MAFRGFSLNVSNNNKKRPLPKALDEFDSDPGSDDDSDNDDPASKRKRIERPPADDYPQQIVPQSSKRLFAGRKTKPFIPDGIQEKYIIHVWIKLSNIPASATEEDVSQIILKARPDMKILSTKLHQPTGPSSEGKMAPTVAWIVECDKQYNALDYEDLSKAVGTPYAGEGLYVHMERFHNEPCSTKPKQDIKPFGARPRTEDVKVPNTNMHAVAPPPALVNLPATPPVSFDVEAAKRKSAQLALRARNPNTINVFVPRDKFTLQLVNMVSELVVTGGLECEAALMNMPTIKKDPKYAWLYDQTHQLNHYYRWNLWRLTRQDPSPEIFDGQGEWVCPDGPPPFEFACSRQDIEGKVELQAPEPAFYGRQLPTYLSRQPPVLPHEDSYQGHDSNGGGYLNIFARMQLMNMLREYEIDCKYFDSNAKIARISVFAHSHASHGATEIADTLIENVFQPLHKIVALGTFEPPNMPATLNALRILSDVVMVSKRAGGLWNRYVDYIGPQLQQRGVFLHLRHLVREWEAMKGVNAHGFVEAVQEMLGAWDKKKAFKESLLNDYRTTFRGGK